MTLYDWRLAAGALSARDDVRRIARAVGQYLIIAGAHAALGVWVEYSKDAMGRAMRGEP